MKTLFAGVDQTATGLRVAMADYLDAAAAHPAIQHVRHAEQRMLDIRAGERVLDAGCGLGEVARSLAAVVGPAGRVDAVDTSQTLLEHANRRLREQPLPPGASTVNYYHGDLRRLDTPDGSFDLVRCERVLQHLADPDAAVAELVRVTRPGGQVSLVDTDWQSLSIEGVPADLFARLAARMRQGPMTAWHTMGRTLRARLLDAGLVDVQCRPVTACFVGRADAAPVVGLLDVDMLATILATTSGNGVGDDDTDLASEWRDAVRLADQRDRLLTALTIWVVVGRKRPETAAGTRTRETGKR
ncbi:methyltransferase domain-containing protein [Phytohabitans sp. LJ34]|uniref:methyltransferase domain-containing protein n=1 Tax=Phytohabitans sp. LJ34 TaxID=3452217 RepID=UPI003F889065